MSADDFFEMVERFCVNGWRSVFGRDFPRFSTVDSVLVTHRVADSGKWVVSFAIRSNGSWCQAKREIEPVEYDIFGDSESPDKVAAGLSMDMVAEVARKMGAIHG